MAPSRRPSEPLRTVVELRRHALLSHSQAIVCPGSTLTRRAERVCSYSMEHDPLGEVIAFYGHGMERDRLLQGRSRLEGVRMQQVLADCLPPPPAAILDCGGGAGAYAIPLAAQGYEVHLLDPVPLHIEQALADATSVRAELASARIGDARRLPFADAHFDVVLLLGALYHLPKRTDRIVALTEALRVTRAGGLLVAAAISRYAALIDGLATGRIFQEPEYLNSVLHERNEGNHRNETSDPRNFTTAFFHRPDELGQELTESGWRDCELLGLEGLGWGIQDFDERWADESYREVLLRIAEAFQEEQSLVAASPHMIGVARKSDGTAGHAAPNRRFAAKLRSRPAWKPSGSFFTVVSTLSA